MMAKAVLVIDMPDNCDKCILQRAGFCSGVKPYRFVYATGFDMGKRQDWCPLKPMPGKVDIPYLATWDDGWNACIDKILGGNK